MNVKFNPTYSVKPRVIYVKREDLPPPPPVSPMVDVLPMLIARERRIQRARRNRLIFLGIVVVATALIFSLFKLCF